MSEPYRTKTFKHGNSTAIRFPKEWGVRIGQWFDVTRRGDVLVFRMIDVPRAASRP